jgi:hypothetical protein
VLLLRKTAGFFVPPVGAFMFGAEHRRVFPESPGGTPAVWWITRPAEDGIPLTAELSLFPLPAPIRPDGDLITFRQGGNGFRYLVSGGSFNNEGFVWTNLWRTSFLFATPPAQHDVHVVFDAMSAEPNHEGPVPQPADVSFNGTRIGHVVAAARGESELVVPAAEWNRAPQALLQLDFPAAFAQPDPARPGYEDRGAWALWSVRFKGG